MSDSVSVFQKFADFDDSEVFARAVEEGAKDDAQNFVVRFGYESAQIAFNLDGDDIGAFLKAPVDSQWPVRWINIWMPDRQRTAVKEIGKHYNFSKRLQLSIIATGATKPAVPNKPVASEKSKSHATDLEHGANGSPHIPVGTPKSAHPPIEFDMREIVNDNMNYTSIDHGDQFICIGANWLHKRPLLDSDVDDELVPPKHWSWLALCSESTVISVHATPFYEKTPEGKTEDEWRQGELNSIRSNVISVLLQLSKEGFEQEDISLLKSIRQALGTSVKEGYGLNRASSALSTNFSGEAVEGSSNLFYYLFEDYSAVVPILRKSKDRLDLMTSEVLASGRRTHSLKKKAQHLMKSSDIIPTLHASNKELRQLKHWFEAFKALIQKIRASRNADMSGPSISRDERKLQLSPLARNRFERLEDRLQLLMLNRIQEYLEEHKALSDTYFNLTAQKDSEATARLTRSAALLAKLSVLFVPIGLMTSYFSVQIPDLTNSYTGRTYWISFAVIASLSFLGLFFFGRLLMFASEIMDDTAERLSMYFSRRLRIPRPPGEDDD